MNLLSFLAILFLLSTVFDKSVEELWEEDADAPLLNEMQLQARFGESTVKSGTRKYGKSDAYSSVQNHTSDDTVLAKSLQNRIVGGTIARQGDIPWQASVIVFLRNGDGKLCGASIIHEFWLVSAAHCFVDGVEVQVTVGDFHLHSKDNGEQRFTVSRVYNHESYDRITDDNDIALLRINPSPNGKGIVFNNVVRPISLPAAGTFLGEGTRLLVSGWGGTLPCVDCKNEPQVTSDVLKKAEFPIIDQWRCQQVFRKVTSRMVCAGYHGGNPSPCHGDSGGPAAYKTAGQYVLYGIVSWGAGCAQPGKPAVYTRVTSFLHWIKSKIQF